MAQVKEALTFIGHCWREDSIEWDTDLLERRRTVHRIGTDARVAAQSGPSVVTAIGTRGLP